MLIERGFSAIQAETWAKFIGHVFQIYWDAASELLEPANWNEFKAKAGVLGKERKLEKGVCGQVIIEDAITSEIGHRAQRLRQGLPSGHFLRFHETKFEIEALVESQERAGRHSKKVDFRALSQIPARNPPSIAIEAKPLLTENDIRSRYLADEGIGCFFASDSAYTTGPVGAMLAYSMTVDGRSMRDAISAAVLEYQPAPIGFHRVTVTGPGVVDCSQHDRQQWSLQPVTILHVELQFPLELQS